MATEQNTVQSQTRAALTAHARAELDRVAEASLQLQCTHGHGIGPMEVTHPEADSRIAVRLAQADALLSALLIDGYEPFSRLHADIQQHYLGAVQSLVSAARADVVLLENRT